MKLKTLLLTATVCWALTALALAPRALVLQTDFGVKDGAVAAMRGVAFGVSPKLAIFDLSHENTPFDIWEAAYRLKQTVPYWPTGTVFVSVVDPGVGTERKSVVLETRTGHFFVGPDNGTFTLVAEECGIVAVREIDEARNRRHGTERSYTFHAFKDVGPQLPARVVTLDYERARLEGAALAGTIPALDYQYGNVWTNLDEELFAQLDPKYGQRFRVTITQTGRNIYEGEMPYVRSFGDVAEGAPLLYINSLMNLSVALNMGDFAKTHHIGRGAQWAVRVEKISSQNRN